MPESPVASARALLRDAVRDRVSPAIVAEVGASEATIWREAFGRLSPVDEAAPAGEDTVFDLASLTKPMATASIVLKLAALGRLQLDDLVSGCLADWVGPDRSGVTIRHLLEHCSGLPARLLDRPPEGRREFEHDICRMPLEYAPASRSVYSDLGFILLGFIAADRGAAPLEALFEEIAAATWAHTGISPGPTSPLLAYRVPEWAFGRTAATTPLPDDLRRGRRLVAEVHDDYAARLGGAAGHAGLFGCARGVGCFARLVLRGIRGASGLPEPFTADTLRTAVERSPVPGSSRALGWDTMLPTSSCGSLMSPSAFGHVGFTGTSLWIDPDRDRYYVLLTNRIAGAATADDIGRLRRRFHELLAGV